MTKIKKEKKELPKNGGTIKVTDFFGFWSPGAGSYPMFNNVRITPENIDKYKLWIRYEDEEVVFYTWYKRKKGDLYVAHYKSGKNKGHLDWGEGLQDAIDERF